MKNTLVLLACAAVITACKPAVDKEAVKKEIFKAEKEFEKMATEKSMLRRFIFSRLTVG